MAGPTAQEVKTLEIPSTVKNLIEALIFAAKEPLTVKQIKAIYESEGPDGEVRKIEAEEIREIIAELNEDFQRTDKPYRIIQIAEGFQFATLKQYADWLGKLYKEQARRKLSQSSVETLAIIAYKQPVSRPEIEAIRGVNCDYVLATLLEKDLVTIVGRAPTAGRPLLYGTTREFLKHFGLNDITDLPRPREIEEILGESEFETERRMLEAQAGALEANKEEDFKSRLPHIPKRKPELSDEVKILPKKRQRELKPQTSEKPVTDETIRSGETQHAEKVPNNVVLVNEIPDIKDRTVFSPRIEELSETVDERNSSGMIEADAPNSRAAAGRGENSTSEPQETPPQQEVERPHVAETESPAQELSKDGAGIEFNAANGSGRTDPSTSVGQQEENLPPLPQYQPKSAWHTWKEKIQIFIRKLFA
jgi:segregation and condensation protein B